MMSNNLDPTISLLIPVFDDARVFVAIESALAQSVEFDEILVQNPNGKYSSLVERSKKIRVLVESDRNLFDGLDILIQNAKSDYVVMIGSDDFFIDDQFVERAKANIAHSNADIYAERSAMKGESLRVWPSKFFVKKGWVLPSHFGAVISRRLATKYQMDSFTDSDILANDSIWLLKILNLDTPVIECSNKLSLCMLAGGVSTGSQISVISNLKSLLRKTIHIEQTRSAVLFKAISALGVKTLFWVFEPTAKKKADISRKQKQLEQSAGKYT